MQNSTNPKLTPAYISGLVQADGSFHIAVDRNKSYKLGIRITPKLILSQHISAKPFFKDLINYLGVGHLNTHRDEVQIVVNSLPQIKQRILPLFDLYPVRSGKLISYLKFKQVVEMMELKEHLTAEGLAQIIEISYDMNLVSQRKPERKLELLKLIGFEQGVTVKNPIIPIVPSMDPHFVSGLTEGDGTFFISFRANRRIVASYTVIQESSSKGVLTELTEFFNCGAVYDLPSAASRFQVQSLDKLINHVIPHFSEFPLHSVKKEHFEIFSQVCHLLKARVHKTDEGLQQIIDLAYNMNKEGKGRRLTKEGFIQKMDAKSSLKESSFDENSEF